MCARLATATAALASARGGSIMPTRPSSTRSSSMLSGSSKPDGSLPAAAAAHRCPERRPGWCAWQWRACAAPGRPAPRCASTARRDVARRARTGLPSSQTKSLFANRTSGAPFTKTRKTPGLSGSRCTVVWRLRSEVKGISAMRGKRANSDSPMPNLRAATISAPSVGSPCTRQRSSLCVSAASLASAAARSTCATASRAGEASVSGAPSMVKSPSGM